MSEIVEFRRYVTKNGRDIYGEWLSRLKDVRTQAKITAYVDRLAFANFSNCKSLGGGLFELRIDWGPGYRVYYAMIERRCFLLLAGGDKRKQNADIARAIEYFEDYKLRSRKP